MTLERWEVRQGLALYLDPSLLLANDAGFTGGRRGRARGLHYFLCLSVEGRQTDWVATSSRPAVGRARLLRKWGNRSWVEGDSYADQWQVWTVDIDVVRLVARTCDRSQRGARNYGDVDGLALIAA